MFADIKMVFRSRKFKGKQYNGQKKKKDRNTTQKAQDRTTRTPLIIGGELGGPGMHETLTIGRMITKMKILDLVHTIRFWNNIHQVHSE